MAAEVALDVLENILVGLDVKDIIRCKSVCKSWQSFVSSPRFVKAHLKHAYKIDCENIDGGHRRIGVGGGIHKIDFPFNSNALCLVGSCNGLVCVSPVDAELVVANTWTRESRILQKAPYPTHRYLRLVECWGFGYDAITDDYKVIAGFRIRERTTEKKKTLFHVLSLKSSFWKVIGEVGYKCVTNKCGILCDGALHWFMGAAGKNVIMSLDLSTEEWKEIPLPAGYQLSDDYFHGGLGVIEECLCITSYVHPCQDGKTWVMKNNKWEVYNNNNNNERKYGVAHNIICRCGVDSQNKTRYDITHADGILVPNVGYYIRANIFVKSLVSPHSHGQTKV